MTSILVVGRGPTQKIASANHDRKLQELLEQFRVRGIKINKKKLRLRMHSVSYMRHKLTAEDLRADQIAISEMQPPKSVSEVRRIISVVSYLSQFLPHLADLCEPLRQLTRKLRN